MRHLSNADINKQSQISFSGWHVQFKKKTIMRSLQRMLLPRQQQISHLLEVPTWN